MTAPGARVSAGSLALTLLLVSALTSALAAQNTTPRSLPQHQPLNPMAASRSGLYVQPYADPSPRWVHSLSFDYGSAVEWEEVPHGGFYVLDAELMRVQFSFRKDISEHRFLQLSADLNGVFNGFADAAFDWYHSTIGIGFRGREQRPSNTFAYQLTLPDGRLSVQRARPDYYIGDARVSYGIRHTPHHQTTLSLTLPTSSAPEGYSRETLSASVIHTLRRPITERWTFEGTAAGGYTPAKGDLDAVQKVWFASGSAGVRLRAYREHTLYGYFFAHSPYYSGTHLPELENPEITADFGWMLRTKSGHEWRFGLTEDLGPKDHGIDLILRAGVSW